MISVSMENTRRISEQGKRCVCAQLTRSDSYRSAGQDTWTSNDTIEHDTRASEIRIAGGRYVFKVGDTVQINPLLEGKPIQVQILSIRAVEPKKLTAASWVQLGYIDYEDYMADWGEVFGERVWLMAIKPIAAVQP